MQLRALSNRLVSLESQLSSLIPKPQYGIASNVLWTIDGGQMACDDDGRALGPINPDAVQLARGWAVVCHPASTLPLHWNGHYCSCPYWFPSEDNGADYLLRCSVHGAIPIEAILAGAQPFPLSPDLDGRLIAPWSNWREENRIVRRWNSHYLTDFWTDFVDMLECEWLSEFWREQERHLADRYAGIRERQGS
jgi:hypothetical protein